MLEQRIIAMTVLTVIHLEVIESSSDCCFDKDKISQIIRVDENKTAVVSCPVLAESETLKFISLHKGNRILHAKNMENDTLRSQQHDRVHLFEQNSSFSYKILRSEVNDSGLYYCMVRYYATSKTDTTQTILLVEEPLEPTEPPSACPFEHTLPFTVGCGIIITYNLFITVSSVFLAYKLNHKEPPENPYMNTRPGGFRRR